MKDRTTLNKLTRPPTFGALMRITWQHVRSQLLGAIHEAGYTNFQDAHFAVFSYPLPDGVRPSELARQKKMSRQAVNYLLGQLEGLGYVERRPSETVEQRLVYLTPAGQEIAEAIFNCLEKLQKEWSADVGPERFAIFLEVLKSFAEKAEAERG